MFDSTLVEADIHPAYVSSAASDRGCVRTSNQDAFLEQPEAGLWAVADGMGGHRDGDIASRMVCDALSGLCGSGPIENAIDGVRGRMSDVNRRLREAAARGVDPTVSGSTVAMVLARRTACAILWAGDSRVYRLRYGRLSRLTADHSWTGGSKQKRALATALASPATFHITCAPVLAIRVLELGGGLAAAYATKLLVDLGASVTKVEPLQGDMVRRRGPVPSVGTERGSGLFQYLNAGKASLGLDTTVEADRRQLSVLAAQHDILIESLGPSRLEELRLLRPEPATAPTAVVRISPFGQTGPYRDRAATSAVLQAAGGWTARIGTFVWAATRWRLAISPSSSRRRNC